MRPLPTLPGREALDTLFLDVGNTLVSMDFGWIAEILSAHGLETDTESVRRAEAAARPATSLSIQQHSEHEPARLFCFRMGLLLDELEARTLRRAGVSREALLEDLDRRLRRNAGSRRLWSSVMNGVPEALERLRGAGLQLVVVSNADGTIEPMLEEVGLSGFFAGVIDSHHVGFEKPDRRIFDHALERVGADRARTLHVGDLYHADVCGARAAGLKPLLLDPYQDWQDVDCARMDDLGELARHLVDGS